MRRFFSRNVSSATAALNVREMLVYSEQSPILQANQAARKSESNIWIEKWEVSRAGLTPLKSDDKTTTVTIRKQLELFNADTLATPLDIPEIPQHFSYASRKAYGSKLQMELADRAAKLGYQSKAWLSRAAANKEGKSLKPDARPVIVLTMGSVELYHSSQLAGDSNLAIWPVSGGTRRLYSTENSAFTQLQEHTANNSFSSALYFTKNQLEQLNLALAEGAEPCEVSSAGNPRNQFAYYNLDQLVTPDVVMEALGRVEADVDCFLLSGEPITNTAALSKRFKSKFWISGKDCEIYGYEIKPDELGRGASLSSVRNTSSMYNVDQLADPSAGYANAGLISR